MLASQSLVGFEVVVDAMVILMGVWSNHVMGSMVEQGILCSTHLSTKKLLIREYKLCGAEK